MDTMIRAEEEISTPSNPEVVWRRLGIPLTGDALVALHGAKRPVPRERSDPFRTVIDALPALVWCLLPNGSLDFTSRRWKAFTGQSEEQARGSGWNNLVHADDVRRLLSEFQLAFNTGACSECEARLRRFDGEYRWFLFRLDPQCDDAGQMLRWYVFLTDIEERKQAEARERSEMLALPGEAEADSSFEDVIGSSEPIRSVLRQVAKIATGNSTVLILGETGTGKELIARAIHRRSTRSARPLIRVNCAAIPQALIASELFGHEKGAFTGAVQRRLGRFESAHRGTIFLDEVGELPPETQIALLRVLQERELERVGGTQTVSVDVRVIAATNRDLYAAVEAGTFRRDLFYRLNVIPLQLPALRERKADIRLLTEHFLARFAKTGRRFRRIATQTLDLFDSYSWPGNIRELQNVVERAVILCEGDTFRIEEEWLFPDGSSRTNTAAPDLNEEKQQIEDMLRHTGGRVSGPAGAAVKLGIPRQTLESRMRKFGINSHRFKKL